MLFYLLGIIPYKTVRMHKKNSLVLVRARTIPTELPPLIGEVSANFLQIKGVTWSAQQIPPSLFSVFQIGAAAVSSK
jgi:hypothetical protein